MLLLKTDSLGSPQWAKEFSESVNMIGHTVVQTDDGGYFLGGTRGLIASQQDMYVIKTQANGTLEWARAYGGGNRDVLSTSYLANDGGFLLSGLTNSFGNGDNDIYFVKLDASGNGGCNSRATNLSVSSPSISQSNWTPSSASTGASGTATLTAFCVQDIDSTLCSSNEDYIFSQSFSICEGDSILAGGSYQLTTSHYYDTLSAASGCDSIICTFLAVQPKFDTTIDVTICTGDSYFAGGANQSNSGAYYDTLVSSDACLCDSIITTNLTVTTAYKDTINVELCPEDSIFAGGVYQNTSGIYYDTLSSSDGCDSVVCTSVTVLHDDPITFHKTYGTSVVESSSGIQQTSDGGYIIGGGRRDVDGS